MLVRWALWVNSGIVVMGTVAVARIKIMKLLRP
jgi:hypothetical protein